MLKATDITFSYRQNAPVLEGIRFSVPRGEILAILGPNGVGKTTLLKSINGIIRPQSGSVTVDNTHIYSLSPLECARKIAYVSQYSNPSRMTAFDAVLLGRKPHIGWKTSSQDMSIVDEVISRLGLEHLSMRYIDEMSGGELQKVSIGRALVQQTPVLLLDEPTSSLDLKNQLEILKTIRQVVKEHSMAAVMTMHDLNLAFRYCDRFILIKEGKVFGGGSPDEITSAMIASVYEVEVDIITHNGQPMIVPVQ